MRSEVDETNSKLSDNTSQVAENKFRTLKHSYKNLLYMMMNFIDFDIPPMDNLNDKAWHTFVKRIKKKFVEQKIANDHLEESIKNYKSLLDMKCVECSELDERLHSKFPHFISEN